MVIIAGFVFLAMMVTTLVTLDLVTVIVENADQIVQNVVWLVISLFARNVLMVST